MDSLQQAGPSGLRSVTRRELYNMMQNSSERTFEKKLEYMIQEMIGHCEDSKVAEMKNKLSIIRHQFKQRWLTARYIKTRFEKDNAEWLRGTILLPSSGVSPGRPQKSFDESSDRSKRRKTKNLRSTELEQLTYATQMKLRKVGKVDASKVIKDLTKSPRRATKYLTAMKKRSMEQEEIHRLSPLDALSMFTDAGLTKAQYERIRETNKTFFPCYSILQKAKQECYPDIHRVIETCAEIQVQKLLDHTTTRLILHLREVVNQLSLDEKQSMTLISKWGCDGSQQMQYKMKFENVSDCDANVFQSSMVPIQLVYGPEKKILWQNPTPSSPRYCRPIRIRFVKETTDITNEEIAYITSQIKSLSKTEFEDMAIKHKMLFTMVDGKVCNAATHNKSTMKCYICGATSYQFNDLSKKRPSNKKHFRFGLSLLHARIRFFESILHVAYKLPVKKWNIRLSAEEKKLVDEKKKEIQGKFRQQLGLLVDIPKANFGNTNDGNTSRRFFDNYEMSAEITGVDENLIFRMKVILDTLCCGYKINCEKFEEYCHETAELYTTLYGFYPMSPTMHKILIHASEVIKEAILPIGQLSEEAAEARNKHIRIYRQNYSRKFSRISCNMDVLNRLLITSDPLLTSIRKVTKKNKMPMLKDVLNLLSESDISNVSNLSSSSNNDEIC